MCHYLKYDLLNDLLIISTIVNGKKHAIFCWTQIQRSDGGRHILVWPCIPAIRYAILIAKSIFLHLLNTAATAAVTAHSGRKRQKRTKSEKKYFKILRDIGHYEQLIVDAGNGIG